MFPSSMILEMPQDVDGDTSCHIFWMWTGYLAAALQSSNVIFDMPAECVLLTEGPRAVFE